MTTAACWLGPRLERLFTSKHLGSISLWKCNDLREEAKCMWTPYTHLFFRGLISYCWYNPPAGSSVTAHRGGHRHQATQTNPQLPTGDARYGLSSLIFCFVLFFSSLFARFLSIHLYSFIILTFTCTLHTSLLLTLPLILHLYLLRT